MLCIFYIIRTHFLKNNRSLGVSYPFQRFMLKFVKKVRLTIGHTSKISRLPGVAEIMLEYVKMVREFTIKTQFKILIEL